MTQQNQAGRHCCFCAFISLAGLRYNEGEVESVQGIVRNWSSRFRSDQIEYVWLILLASLTGALAALGNLGFGLLIDFSTYIFRGLEWRALGIEKGGAFVLLTPLVLLSGGVALLVLNYFFPGDVLGYGFPNFLAMVHLGGAAQTPVDTSQGGRCRDFTGRRSVGRTGGTNCPNRRFDRFSRSASAPSR